MAGKTTYEQFVASATNARLLEQERFIVEATECIATAMEKEGVSKSDLASRLGKSKAFVTQLLGGGRNMTLRTLADVMTVLGHRARIVGAPTGVNKISGKAS